MRHVLHLALLAGLVACGDVLPNAPAAHSFSRSDDHVGLPPQYVLTKLPTFGGTSRGTAINDRGWVAGFSNLTGNAVRRAALWHDGQLDSLGSLGGPNSSVVWPGLDNDGMVVGIAETAATDPFNEDWSCSNFFPSTTHKVCVGFAWQDGVMTPLPTFGGDNGFATGVNNHGQVVGWAETPIHDPTCNKPQVLQFRAAMWEPRKNRMTQLQPLHGDSTSAATAINDRGQAVGISGRCDVAVGEFSAQHAVLWDNGTVTDIGSLGGVAWNTPMAINENGMVVGFSDLPGDDDGTFNARAFRWTKQTGIDSLGAIGSDPFSEALGVNNLGQVVGISFGGASGSRGFLWQNGKMYNLKDLMGAGFADVIVAGQDINDAGVITGRMIDHTTGKTVAFVATPVRSTP